MIRLVDQLISWKIWKHSGDASVESPCTAATIFANY